MDKAPARFKAGAALLAVIIFVSFAPATRAAPLTAAVFPFELDDTSLEGAMRGVQPAEQARLRQLDGQLRAALAASGRYRLVDTAPVAPQIGTEDLRVCPSCAVALAQKLGAAVEVNAWVQKVSTLILNINVVVRDAASGRVIDAGSADIRGDTDESWHHGLAWLLRHRILVAGGTP